MVFIMYVCVCMCVWVPLTFSRPINPLSFRSLRGFVAATAVGATADRPDDDERLWPLLCAV